LIDSGETAPELRYNLAYACLLAGRHEEAKTALEPLVSEGGQVPGAAMLLARTHHYLGDLDKAIQVAEAYEQAYPGDAQACSHLAMLYFDAADLEKAKSWCDKAFVGGKETPEAHFTAGLLALGYEDQEGADRHLATALELNPKSGRAWAGRGLSLMLRGDLSGGAQALQRAVELMPKHIGTWHALAWCKLLSGDLDGAEDAFKRSLEIDRSFADTHGGLAIIALQRGDRQEADVRSKTALRLDPRSMSAQYARLLLDPKLADPKQRQEKVRLLLTSQKALGGGTLLDLVGRQVARRKEAP
jgi:Tfp pilus assembly protein PilF